MKLISLFSGIGGFELAAEWMGWQNLLSCEINQFGRKVLAHYWPNSYHHTDIHTLNFEIVNDELTKRFGPNWNADNDLILAGGFPCQPYSLAGKRKGKDDERHLWPEMLRVITELRPRWVVGENVLGIINWNDGMVFNEVQSDLEAAGYEVWPYVLPACGVNAPHQRYRTWFVAKNTDKDGRGSYLGKNQPSKREQRNACARNNERVSTDNAKDWFVAHANNKRGRGEFGEISEANGEIPQRNNDAELGNTDTLHDVFDSNNKRLQRGENDRITGKRGAQQKQFAPRFIQSNWENFPTQSPICGGDDGLPTELDGITFSKWRNESIKAYGNAIVPQVALQIFKTIQEYEYNIHLYS